MRGCCAGLRSAIGLGSYTNLPEPEPELRFLPEKKMQQFRRITGAVEGVMLPPRVVRIDDEGRAAPAR